MCSKVDAVATRFRAVSGTYTQISDRVNNNNSLYPPGLCLETTLDVQRELKLSHQETTVKAYKSLRSRRLKDVSKLRLCYRCGWIASVMAVVAS